ncbi:MAG: hypothetical protein M1832_004460 [Thelocarpon impressellum]|nr:MAG: hypothetical protein M1832_004460 [Thelocarpon impressellum]
MATPFRRDTRLDHVAARVVNATATGDTFVGAFAVVVVQGPLVDFDVRVAVERANSAASKSVQTEGAENAIPWLDEL